MKGNCYDIFKYLNPKDNDKLSLFSECDINELICYLDKFYLEYRDNLGFSRDITFGVEIESENLIYSLSGLNDIFMNGLLGDWLVRNDSSLDKGCEIKSPKLVDSIHNWLSLSRVCYILNKYSKIGKNSGGHVHIDSGILGKEGNNWLNFIRLWASYENVIFRFCYGEHLTHRPSILSFANMVANQFVLDYEQLKNSKINYLVIAHSLSHNNKNLAVNFKNVGGEKNTIEFRCPNGTLNPVIWQNNINLFVHLLEYSKSSKFDEDIISKRFLSVSEEFVSLSYYKDIFIDQALELCDLIFDNNLDKIYFLRQYLKNFEIGNFPLELAKPFVRV